MVKKYVMARSAAEAIEKERSVKVDDVFIDTDWWKLADDKNAPIIGY